MSKLIKVLFVFGIFCFAVNSQSFAQVEDDWGPRVMVETPNDQMPQNSTITSEVKASQTTTVRSSNNVVAIKPSSSNNTGSLFAYLRFMFRFYFSNPFFLS